MRILVLYCHPNPESFGAALHETVVASLRAAGHQVDDCDLYAEDFHPVLSRQERLGYHDLAHNTEPVADYVRRLREAEALVLVFPVWNFGFPALLKGFFDRMFMPGVGFDISDPAAVKPLLGNIRSITGIVTYGRSFWYALWMGDPPRKIVMRYLWWFTGWKARRRYCALYHMNVATPEQRAGFIAKVKAAMAGV